MTQAVMDQAVLTIESLPPAPIDAASRFHDEFIPQARQLLDGDFGALAIVLPLAASDHDDWRRAIARDLARAFAPKRVNVTSASAQGAIAPMLAYLRDAPGVTGQYLAMHE
ncbi:MAG: Rossmann fold domain-containing protein [Erythrobacter sp.]